MKWTLHLHVGNAEDASEHIDSLWEFVSSARYKAFHFSVSRSFARFAILFSRIFFCLIQTLLHLYTYILKPGKLASMLNTLRWKLFASWYTEFSVLFPSSMECMHSMLLIKWECTFMGSLFGSVKLQNYNFGKVPYDFTSFIFRNRKQNGGS